MEKLHVGTRIEITIVVLLSLLFSIAAALSFGQDLNWDLANYHYYAPFSIVYGRSSIDIAPSQLQTWFNPLPSLISYALISTFQPKVATAILAALSSFSIVFVVVASISCMTDEYRGNSAIRWFVAAIAFIGAASSPMFLSEVGTTFQDVLAGTFVLGALALLLTSNFSRKAYFFSGILLGISVSIKLTNAVYVVGYALALVVTERQRFLIPASLSAGGAILAFLPIGGLWLTHVYLQTGNPFFPAYNDVFESPLYPPLAMVDSRFRPDGIAGGLRYFVETALGTHPGSEVKFYDIRFLLSAVLLCGFILSGRLSGGSAQFDGNSPGVFLQKNTRFILVFCVASFSIWLPMFGIQRYAVGIEQISPVLIVILLYYLSKSRRVWLVSSTVCVVAIVAFGERANWGRTSFSDDWFEVGIPQSLADDDALYVMLSGAPMSYVIPFMPASSIFVRIDGNMPLDPKVGLGERAARVIASHKGPIRSMFQDSYPLEAADAALASFSLVIKSDECAVITSKLGSLRSCQLNRTAAR